MELGARLNADEELGGRVLKVNHAGENGAVNIYAGQILCARLTARDMVSELREFRSHEERHRSIFDAELERRGLRRCRSYLFCGVGGYMLGVISGLLGRRAIAATTVAVERVVLGHLSQQVQVLSDKDPAAVRAISEIVADEKQHFEQSASHLQPGRFWPSVITPVVAISTEAVIWLGMHL
jgi:3-demethoxyubiquinol 3-hydroxylase